MIYKITTNNGYCEFCFEFQQVKESLELQCEEYEEQLYNLTNFKELSDETKVNILKDMMRMGAEF